MATEAGRAFRTTLAIVLSAAWLTLAAWASGVCLLIAALSVATFFGEPPTGEYVKEGVAWALAGGAAATAGPLGVWFFHRHRAWLWIALVAATLCVLYALYILFVFGSE
jgi:hypothetical protein